MLTPSGPMGQTHWGDTTSNSPSATAHSAEAQLKVLQYYALFHFLLSLHLILFNFSNLSVKRENFAKVANKNQHLDICF